MTIRRRIVRAGSACKQIEAAAKGRSHSTGFGFGISTNQDEDELRHQTTASVQDDMIDYSASDGFDLAIWQSVEQGKGSKMPKLNDVGK